MGEQKKKEKSERECVCVIWKGKSFHGKFFGFFFGGGARSEPGTKHTRTKWHGNKQGKSEGIKRDLNWERRSGQE